jgi:NAD+ kinase
MKRVAVLANHEKSGVATLLDSIRNWAAHRELEFVANPGPDTQLAVGAGPFGDASTTDLIKSFTDSDVLVTLGGDGTLLYAAQLAAPLNLPVLSVNLGSLGFHTQVAPENLVQALDLVQNGRFETESRLLLHATVAGKINGDDRNIIALNDIAISKSLWGHMVVARILIDEQLLTDVAADAILVSSATGSSAYNFAANGPVLHPSVEGIILNAICAHRMKLSPLVIPPTATLQIDFRPRREMDQAQILVDGQLWTSLVDHERLKISRASMYLRLIVFEDDFYGKLRKKLHWGGLL